MTFINLTKKQKKQFKEYCDKKYGMTIVKSEAGEPLYFNEKNQLINTQFIIDLLFVENLN